MSLKKKCLVGFVLSAVLLVILSTTLLPMLVRKKMVEEVGKATGRKIRLEQVWIDPLHLSFGLSGFAIEGPNGGPFLSFDSASATLSLASIYRRALVLDEVHIGAPSVKVTRLAANSYDFSDILERLKQAPKKQSKGGLLFSVNNIGIKNGSVQFQDQAPAGGGATHTIRNLDIAIPFVSNMPYLAEKYVEPHLSAVVDGAPFHFQGKTKPLSNSLETKVQFDVRQLNLPQYLGYLPIPPPVNLVSGQLSLDAEIRYRISRQRKPELVVKGIARLDQVLVQSKDHQPLVKFPKLEVKATSLELMTRRFLVESVTLREPELFVSRSARGEWIWDRILPSAGAKGKGSAQNTEKREAGPKPDFRLAAFKLTDGRVRFRDLLPRGGFESTISDLNLTLDNLSTESGQAARYQLGLLVDGESSLDTEGSVTLTPLSATAAVELEELKIDRAWPYLSRFLTRPVKGSVDLAARVSYSQPNGVAAEQGVVTLRDLSASYGDHERAEFPLVELTGIGYRQKTQEVVADQLRVNRARVSLTRGTDGKLSPLSLLRQAPPRVAAPAQPVKKGAKKKETTFRLNKLSLEQCDLAFTDQTRVEKPRFTLTRTQLTLSHLTGPRPSAMPITFSSTFNNASALKIAGNLAPNPLGFKGKVSVERLPLRDFEAYFPDNVNIFLVGGAADANMALDIALKEGKPAGSFRGNAGIRALHAMDTVTEEDLLKWESLQLDELQGTLGPFSLALREISLNGVYSRIVIGKDGTLNLQNLVQKPASEPAATAPVPAVKVVQAAAATPAPAPAPPATEIKPIKVEALTIQGGTLSFTDNHLPQRFATTFYNLGGRVSGLSSEATKLAEVDLRGNLENHSPLQITGAINPLRGDLFVDLKVSFRDIELSPVTPYSGTYLGYAVEKGKLFLDLKYRIDRKKLDSENRIFLDQFTFGESVRSDKATRLPVKLGLALLKDRNGEIHLDVPVTGRTDDPQFSVWRLAFQVLRNLLSKAVTSPMALLSSTFGGGHDFSAVQFEPGQSRIAPQEEQKLASLAKALLDRPALKIELKGYVDRERDAEEYRVELLNRKLKNEKFLALSREGKLKEGEKAETMRVGTEEYPAYLKGVYGKEKFPKPRNVLGLVKELPADEMRKLIVANTVIGETEYRELARERVVAVMNHLVTRNKVPAERVFQRNDDVFKAPERERGQRSRVELNAIVQ